MTFEEEREVRDGVHKWATMAVKLDWMNERRWWTRLVHWAAWQFQGVFLKWYDEDEIAASIMGYIEIEHYKHAPERRMREHVQCAWHVTCVHPDGHDGACHSSI